jgi:hypothetical protein
MSAIEIFPFTLVDDAFDHRSRHEDKRPTRTAVGASTPVDVSAHAILRLALRLLVNHGALSPGHVDVYFEDAPTVNGPWRQVGHKRINPGDTMPEPNCTQTFIFSAFNTFLRVRWSAHGSTSPLDLYLGVSGDGKPDAP